MEGGLAIEVKIDEEKMGKNSFLITGGQYAYQRKECIWIVAIGVLEINYKFEISKQKMYLLLSI